MCKGCEHGRHPQGGPAGMLLYYHSRLCTKKLTLYRRIINIYASPLTTPSTHPTLYTAPPRPARFQHGRQRIHQRTHPQARCHSGFSARKSTLPPLADGPALWGDRNLALDHHTFGCFSGPVPGKKSRSLPRDRSPPEGETPWRSSRSGR